VKKTVRELYEQMLEQNLKNGQKEMKDYDPFHLGCLLNPSGEASYLNADAAQKAAYEKAATDSSKLDTLQEGTIASKDALAVVEAVRNKANEVYAMIAPAISGQFDGVTSPGKIRSSLKAIGFKGMLEVAAFADILTLKEALEFDHNIQDDHDFQLSSCCCPMWISMVRKECPELFDAMPASVSPMVAAGRVVKQLHPKALTVFIGPCMAKKKEAKEVDIADAADFVLTFKELKEIFSAVGINPADMPDDDKEHASGAGIIYARAGGVSEAVEMTVKQLNPEREIPFKAATANGAKECKTLLAELKAGNVKANFYEGMGCVGGCVGGPRNILDKEAGKEFVNRYSQQVAYRTPLDNPYILEMLSELGYETIYDFIEKSTFLTRDFSISDATIARP